MIFTYAPTVGLQGNSDPLVPVAAVKELAECIPRSKPEVYSCSQSLGVMYWRFHVVK